MVDIITLIFQGSFFAKSELKDENARNSNQADHFLSVEKFAELFLLERRE